MASISLNKRKGYLWLVLIFIILCIPLWMWLAWLITPKRILKTAILDKTVLEKKGQEHISLNWVLNQERFTKADKELYQPSKDYYGFFPFEDEKYSIKSFENLSDEELVKLSDTTEIVYVTDTYGIYRNEWYKEHDDKEHSPIVYGGMNEKDLFFIEQMKAKHKLIITEFNCIGSPTGDAVRNKFENSFGIKWTGWTGRYFESLDTAVNKEIPNWLIRDYMSQHNNPWPFKKSGIGFVHFNSTIVVLETDTHLQDQFPNIISGETARNYYKLPAKLKYAYWFDIITADTTANDVIAKFYINVNEKGRQELMRYGLPNFFPAITQHIGKDYRFFYFSADFCDNPISMTTSYFKKVGIFKSLFYNMQDPPERESFFLENLQTVTYKNS